MLAAVSAFRGILQNTCRVDIFTAELAHEEAGAAVLFFITVKYFFYYMFSVKPEVLENVINMQYSMNCCTSILEIICFVVWKFLLFFMVAFFFGFLPLEASLNVVV